MDICIYRKGIGLMPRVSTAPKRAVLARNVKKNMGTAFGRNVRKILEDEGITGRELMKRLDRSVTTSVERVIDVDPYVTRAMRIATALNVPLETLITIPSEVLSDGKLLRKPLVSQSELYDSSLRITACIDQRKYADAMKTAVPCMTLEEKLLAAHKLMQDAGMSAEEIVEALAKYLRNSSSDDTSKAF